MSYCSSEMRKEQDSTAENMSLQDCSFCARAISIKGDVAMGGVLSFTVYLHLVFYLEKKNHAWIMLEYKTEIKHLKGLSDLRRILFLNADNVIQWRITTKVFKILSIWLYLRTTSSERSINAILGELICPQRLDWRTWLVEFFLFVNEYLKMIKNKS